jgi:hypothetical protein
MSTLWYGIKNKQILDATIIWCQGKTKIFIVIPRRNAGFIKDKY